MAGLGHTQHAKRPHIGQPHDGQQQSQNTTENHGTDESETVQIMPSLNMVYDISKCGAEASGCKAKGGSSFYLY